MNSNFNQSAQFIQIIGIGTNDSGKSSVVGINDCEQWQFMNKIMQLL